MAYLARVCCKPEVLDASLADIYIFFLVGARSFAVQWAFEAMDVS